MPAVQPTSSWQISSPLQYRPSSQAASSGSWMHMSSSGSQRSVVHSTASAQSGGTPGTQPVAGSPSVGSHVSSPLHQLSSLHRAFVAMCSQAFSCSLHTSSVQYTPSAQSIGAPPPQIPPAQDSPVVQNFPSSQVFASSGWLAQPVSGAPATGSQASSVQGLPSSQSR